MGTVRYSVANGEIIAEKRNGVRNLYSPDPLGSTVALFDATQTKTDTWTYWPYGDVKTHIGSNGTPFQYGGTIGYRQDSASRTYVRRRVLDTARGRWLTEDPIGFGGMDWNLYRYASDRPAAVMDPSGLFDAAWCALICAPVCLVAPELCATCIEDCSTLNDLNDLRKLLDKLMKDRGDCSHPKSMLDCWTKCKGSGKDFQVACQNCCTAWSFDIDEDEKCTTQCEYWAGKKPPPGYKPPPPPPPKKRHWWNPWTWW